MRALTLIFAAVLAIAASAPSSAQPDKREKELKELEQRLDPAVFLRIHRSCIVNIDCVKELRPLAHGEYHVVLVDGTVLTSNRTFKRNLERLF